MSSYTGSKDYSVSTVAFMTVMMKHMQKYWWLYAITSIAQIAVEEARPTWKCLRISAPVNFCQLLLTGKSHT